MIQFGFLNFCTVSYAEMRKTLDGAIKKMDPGKQENPALKELSKLREEKPKKETNTKEPETARPSAAPEEKKAKEVADGIGGGEKKIIKKDSKDTHNFSELFSEIAEEENKIEVKGGEEEWDSGNEESSPKMKLVEEEKDRSHMALDETMLPGLEREGSDEKSASRIEP